eukprot:135735_1
MRSLWWLILLLQTCMHVSGLQCLDETGESVDWYFVYKINSGLNYIYYDSRSNVSSLSAVHGKLLSSPHTAIGATISQIWNSTNNIYDFIAYNDEAPYDRNAEKYGHTKGILAYSSKQDNGYFLIHSWPKFPNFNGPIYNVDVASVQYGQTFLCISYGSFQTMNAIAYQLRYHKPNVYKSFSSFTAPNNMTEILNHLWIDSASIYSFPSNNAVQSFTHFAKSASWNHELYENLVSPYYNQSFIWETWRRHPAEESFCKPHHTYDELNVEGVTLDDGTHWKYTQDHGKSGCSIVAKEGDKPLVCVGDINRMYSQYHRGGGTCCFQHQHLWSALTSAFAAHDTCDSKGQPIVHKPTKQ